ncbi:hypothetical protein QR680_018092 [Steinernema hermaphroditum]|uniref:RNA (guanine-9-)-methyltransferase domain-containing protein 1 n=1 Tax=Steinernema hermaphroditum TaxID=289476 RepID=A0AA39HGV6_9BILA|nr:hypothetical protein QR680_018092 [Steinernema hermaphroditum]
MDVYEVEGSSSSLAPGNTSTDDGSPPLLHENPGVLDVGAEDFEWFCSEVQPITVIPASWLTDELKEKYKELLKFYTINENEQPVTLTSRDKLIKILVDPKGSAQHPRSEIDVIIEDIRKQPLIVDKIGYIVDNFPPLVRCYPQLAKEVIVSRIIRDYSLAEELCLVLSKMDIEVQTVETIYGVAVRCSELGLTIPSDLLGVWISRNITACESVLDDPYRTSRLVRLFCGLIIGLLTCKNPVTKELFDRSTELKSFSVKFSGFKEAGNINWNYAMFMSTSSAACPSKNGLENKFQFAEMNLRHTGNAERTLALVKRAVRMGYDSVVINIDVGDLMSNRCEEVHMDDDEPPKKKKKKPAGKGRFKQQADGIPEPFFIDPSKLDLSALEKAGKRFRQYSRLTVSLQDQALFHMLTHHEAVRKYDILAVRIDDEQILSTLTRKGDFVDLIVYDPTLTKIPWLTKGKLIMSCVENGIGFEISFAGALRDSSLRRQAFQNGRILMNMTRGGRGVIMGSGAEDVISIRAPYDVANMSLLFGAKPSDGRKFVAENARQILLRAESKKTVRGAIHVATMDNVPDALNDAAKGTALDRLKEVPEFAAQLKINEYSMNRIRAFCCQLLQRFAARGKTKPLEPPLEWEAPRLRTYPSKQLWSTLQDEQMTNLKHIVEETEKLSRIYSYFPSTISDADWINLTRIESAKQRLDHIKHLRRREIQKEKDKQKMALKRETRERRLMEMQKDDKQMLMVTNTAKMVSWRKQVEEQSYMRSLLVSKPPTIVFDCRFLPHLSMRGLNLTAMQLQYVISENRAKKEPWPMYFANCDFSLSPELVKAKQKHLTALDSPRVAVPEYTPKGITELFPRERIRYLSPNAEEELETIEDDDVFVIGGIVDRVVEHGIPLYASKEAAEADGVRSVKLPLDKYVKWESGTKYLTLVAVMHILQDVYATRGDWPEVLRRHIPRRNVTGPQEKNQIARAKHQRMREYDRRVLEALKQ